MRVFFDDGDYKNLFLQRKDIFEDDQVVVKTASGTAASYFAGLHYSGYVQGEPNSYAVLSFYPDEAKGIITREDGESYVLDLLNQPQDDLHIIYKESDIVPDESPTPCQTNQSSGSGYKPNGSISSTRSLTGEVTLSVYYELDHSTYLDRSSSIQDCVDLITALHANVHEIYSFIQTPYNNNYAGPDLNGTINLTIGEIFIWDYPDTYPFNDLELRLDLFREHAIESNGDLKHLIHHGTSFDSGIAYIVGEEGNTESFLCHDVNEDGGPFSLAMLGPIPIDIHSYARNIVAHELGHSLGGRHTFSCNWYEEDNNFYAIEAICDETNCILPDDPSDDDDPFTISSDYDATIMSYCWNYTDNIFETKAPFHHLVAQNILDNVCAAALDTTCLFYQTECLEGEDDDFDGVCNDDDCDDNNPNISFWPPEEPIFCNDNNAFTVDDVYISCTTCQGTVYSNPSPDDCNVAIGGMLDFENNFVGPNEGSFINGYGALGNTPDILQYSTGVSGCSKALNLISSNQENDDCTVQNGTAEVIAIYLAHPLPCGEFLTIQFDALYFGTVSSDLLKIYGSNQNLPNPIDIPSQAYEFNISPNLVANSICFDEIDSDYFNANIPCSELPAPFQNQELELYNDNMNSEVINVIYITTDFAGALDQTIEGSRYSSANLDVNGNFVIASVEYDDCNPGYITEFVVHDTTGAWLASYSLDCNQQAVIDENASNTFTPIIETVNNLVDERTQYLLLDNIQLTKSLNELPELIVNINNEEENCSLHIESSPFCTYSLEWDNPASSWENVSGPIASGEELQTIMCYENLVHEFNIEKCGSYRVVQSCPPCGVSVSEEFIFDGCMPAYSIAADPAIICNGAPISLSVPGATEDAFDFLWSTEESSASISITEAGTYDLSLTDVNSLCQTVLSITIESVDISMLLSANPSCLDESNTSATITAEVTGSSNVEYYLNPVGDGTDQGQTSNQFVVEEAGNYIVEVFDLDSGCSTTATIEIIGNDQSVTITNSGLICSHDENSTVVLSTNINDPEASFSWYLNEQIIVGEVSSSLEAVEAGAYSIEVDINNCSSSGEFILEEISFEVAIDDVGCLLFGEELDLHVNVINHPNEDDSDFLYTLDGEAFDGPTFFISASGVHDIEVLDVNSNCSAATSIDIQDCVVPFADDCPNLPVGEEVYFIDVTIDNRISYWIEHADLYGMEFPIDPVGLLAFVTDKVLAFNGSIIIDANLRVIDTDLYFVNDASFDIQPGVLFNALGSSIFDACDDIWSGIDARTQSRSVFDGQGQTLSINNSRVGIHFSDQSFAHVVDIQFLNNGIGLRSDGYIHNNGMRNNYFESQGEGIGIFVLSNPEFKYPTFNSGELMPPLTSQSAQLINLSTAIEAENSNIYLHNLFSQNCNIGLLTSGSQGVINSSILEGSENSAWIGSQLLKNWDIVNSQFLGTFAFNGWQSDGTINNSIFNGNSAEAIVDITGLSFSTLNFENSCQISNGNIGILAQPGSVSSQILSDHTTRIHDFTAMGITTTANAHEFSGFIIELPDDNEVIGILANGASILTENEITSDFNNGIGISSTNAGGLWANNLIEHCGEGMIVEGGELLAIVGNQINNPSGGKGIDSDGAIELILCDNTIQDGIHGALLYNSTSGLVNFTQNTLNRNIGLEVRETDIGPQAHKGNLWDDEFSQAILANGLDELENLFTVGSNPAYFPELSIPFNWFLSEPFSNNLIPCEILLPEFDWFDDESSSNPFPDPNPDPGKILVSCEQVKAILSQLLEAEENGPISPSDDSPYQDWIDYFNELNWIEFITNGILYDTENNYVFVLDATSECMEDVDQLLLLYEIQMTDRPVDRIMRVYQDVENTLSYSQEEMGQITSIISQMADLQNQFHPTHEEYQFAGQLVDSLAQELDTLNIIHRQRVRHDLQGIGISISSIQTNNQAFLDNISFVHLLIKYHSYGMDSFTEEERLDLFQIASTCPIESGHVVFKARSLYRIIFPFEQVEFVSANCIQPRGINLKDRGDDKLVIYPNPVSDVLSIENHIEQWMQIKILDVYGHVVLSFSTSPLENSHSIDVSILQNGVYFVDSGVDSIPLQKFIKI